MPQSPIEKGAITVEASTGLRVGFDHPQRATDRNDWAA
jgi:hypothetical protein